MLAQDALHQRGHDLGGAPLYVGVFVFGVGRDLERLDPGPRARAARGVQQPGRRPDLAAGPDRQEVRARLHRGLDLVEVERHLAEPDDVRSQAVVSARGAGQEVWRRAVEVP